MRVHKGDTARILWLDHSDRHSGYKVGDTVHVLEAGNIPRCVGKHGAYYFYRRQLEPVKSSGLLKDIALASGALFVFMLFLGIAERILA